MKINSINCNNPNFKARWSEKTLACVDKMDQIRGTNFRQQLEKALEENTELKNYGGDKVVLSLGTKPYSAPNVGRFQVFTVNLTQDFDGRKITTPLSPNKSPKYCEGELSSCELDDEYVLHYISGNKTAQNQIVDIVRRRLFKADLVDKFADIFAHASNLDDVEKSKMFDEFIIS